MTVAELIEALKEMPQDALIYAEGEAAENVTLECCCGNKYVRIFKSWDVVFVNGYGKESE